MPGYDPNRSYSYKDLSADQFGALSPTAQKNLRDFGNNYQGYALNADPGAGGGAPAAAAPAPSAGGAGGGGAAPTDMAMAGLGGAMMDLSGPAPGWANDSALAQTAGELGQAIPQMALGGLSAVAAKRGLY